MSQNNAVFQISTLATSIVFSLLAAGCGAAADSATLVAETAVTGTDATTLKLDETSKRRLATPRSSNTISTEPNTATTIPTTTAVTTSISTAPTTPNTIEITSYTTTTTASTNSTLDTNIPVGITNSSSTGLPTRLIQQSDLQYIGSFQLPKGTGGANSFSYGGTALAFNSARNSLIVTGNISNQYVAEVSIPSPAINIARPQDLPAGTLLQTFTNTNEGKLSLINSGDPNGERIGGHYVYNTSLLFTGFSYYDAQGTQNSSHFSRPLDFSVSGKVNGPYKISSRLPRYFAGYMAGVPNEWQAPLGGKVLSGLGNAAIVSAASVGPSALIFDPDQVGKNSSYIGNEVLYYPLASNLSMLYGTSELQQNDVWNIRSNARGAAFPAGTSTIMFFGTHGSGPVCYGSPVECNDPVDQDKGFHAYPYTYQIWSYNAHDLLKVKDGTQAPNSVKPYGVWKFSLPYQDLQGNLKIGGVAFDENNRLLYISQPNVIRANYSSDPVIHVFKVN